MMNITSELSWFLAYHIRDRSAAVGNSIEYFDKMPSHSSVVKRGAETAKKNNNTRGLVGC